MQRGMEKPNNCFTYTWHNTKESASQGLLLTAPLELQSILPKTVTLKIKLTFDSTVTEHIVGTIFLFIYSQTNIYNNYRLICLTAELKGTFQIGATVASHSVTLLTTVSHLNN